MLKDYFRSAFRSLIKHRLFAFINISGLALSLAICLLVIGHLVHELSFEDCHENADRIYRVNGTYTSRDTITYSSQVIPALGPALTAELPEIEAAAVFRLLGNITLETDQERFRTTEEYSRHGFEFDGNVLAANPDFLRVFTIPLIQGDPGAALAAPSSVLISRNAAEVHFPGESPVGREIKLRDDLVCLVTGVMENIPRTTQIHCDFIVSYSTIEPALSGHDTWRNFHQDYVYLLLRRDADPVMTETRIASVAKSHLQAGLAKKYEWELQPLKDIYFSTYNSGRQGDLGPHGESSFILQLGALALFVLLLAVANFINLATARSSQRTKEVGIRKIVGAGRGNLMRQFLGESILITLAAMLLALVFYEMGKLLISPYLPREFLSDFYDNALMPVLLVLLVVVVGVLAGFYPALYLSRFKPIAVLQRKAGMKSSKSLLRKSLILFQFTIAVALVCITIIFYQQIRYISTADLGFTDDNILIVRFGGEKAAERTRLMKTALASQPGIQAMSPINSAPGTPDYTFANLFLDQYETKSRLVKAYAGDHDFLSVFELQLIAGRDFSADTPADLSGAIIITESLARTLPVDNPLGFEFYRNNRAYRVIGVVKDFVSTPVVYFMQSGSIITLNAQNHRDLVVRVEPGNLTEMREVIRKKWYALFPNEPFEYSLLSDDIKGAYAGLRTDSGLFFVLALVAIFMAVMGVFGLMGHTADMKTKEIGIRRTLGATVPDILIHLGKELVVLLVIANAIACPLAYMFASSFLQFYAVQVDIGLGTFVLTAVFGLFLALTAAGQQALRAALANPVEALRHE